MTNTLKHIIEQSKTLSAEERAFIAHLMISSLETKVEPNVEETWLNLADERFHELMSGKDKGTSWEEIEEQVMQQ